jgi:hypothetical protein
MNNLTNERENETPYHSKLSPGRHVQNFLQQLEGGAIPGPEHSGVVDDERELAVSSYPCYSKDQKLS